MTHQSDHEREVEGGIQLNRMLHAETQRQLARLTTMVSELDGRIRQIERLTDTREGQLDMSVGMGRGAGKFLLVVLAAALSAYFGASKLDNEPMIRSGLPPHHEYGYTAPTQPIDKPEGEDDD